jgi:monoamine oxidase
MDVAIIGCGISGLTIAYELLKKENGNNVTLFESSDRVGGRMRTVRLPDGRKYECGAGRVQDSHSRVIALVKELGLTLTEPKAGKTWFINNEGNIIETSPATPILAKLVEKMKPFEQTQSLIDHPLNYFMNRYLTVEERRLLKESIGYEFILHKSNAKGGLDELSVLGGEFMSVVEGIDAITTRLYQEVLAAGGKIHFGEEVLTVHDKTVITTKNTRGKKFDRVVITTPIPITQKILGNNNNNQLLNTVVGIPLLRIYASYKTKWWPDRRVITPLPNQQIIPISDTLIMVAYAGGDTARMWKGLSREETEQCITRLLRYDFPNSPDPEWIDVCDWEVGVHAWRPGADQDLLLPQFIEYAPGIHIVGEVATHTNGWMEGALESVERFMSSLETRNQKLEN